MNIIKDDADIVDRDRLDELAKLPKLAYDRLRKDAAKELGIRTHTLDEMVAARRKQTSTPLPPSVNSDALERSAAAIIHHDNILDLFASELSKAIAGEQRNGRFLYLIATSRLLPRRCTPPSRARRPAASRRCAKRCWNSSRPRAWSRSQV